MILFNQEIQKELPEIYKEILNKVKTALGEDNLLNLSNIRQLTNSIINERQKIETKIEKINKEKEITLINFNDLEKKYRLNQLKKQKLELYYQEYTYGSKIKNMRDFRDIQRITVSKTINEIINSNYRLFISQETVKQMKSNIDLELMIRLFFKIIKSELQLYSGASYILEDTKDKGTFYRNYINENKEKNIREYLELESKTFIWLLKEFDKLTFDDFMSIVTLINSSYDCLIKKQNDKLKTKEAANYLAVVNENSEIKTYSQIKPIVDYVITQLTSSRNYEEEFLRSGQIIDNRSLIKSLRI